MSQTWESAMDDVCAALSLTAATVAAMVPDHVVATKVTPEFLRAEFAAALEDAKKLFDAHPHDEPECKCRAFMLIVALVQQLNAGAEEDMLIRDGARGLAAYYDAVESKGGGN